MSVRIHFLNVGHGDCTIIEHESDRLTMIDINNGSMLDSESASELSESLGLTEVAVQRGMDPRALFETKQVLQQRGYNIVLTNPVEYLSSLLASRPSRSVWRYIQTHPDMDHMRGLTALGESNITIQNFWDTHHEKGTEHGDTLTQSAAAMFDWDEYTRYSTGAKTAKVLRLYQGAEGSYFNQEPEGVSSGDGLYVLAPTLDTNQGACEQGNWNNLSYVLKLVYKGVHVIFGGDAEGDVWASLTENCAAELQQCHVLKASHHGRVSGFHEEAVSLMQPQLTVVSVGKKPETDASNQYRKFSKHVWSTRWHGDVVLTISDAGQVSVSADRAAA